MPALMAHGMPGHDSDGAPEPAPLIPVMQQQVHVFISRDVYVHRQRNCRNAL
jgi:hypothetical protein